MDGSSNSTLLYHNDSSDACEWPNMYCDSAIYDLNFTGEIALVDTPHCSKGLATSAVLFGVILTLVIIVTNILVIVIIRRSKKLNNCQGLIKMNLAVFDLLVACTSMPSAIYNKIHLLFLPLDENYLIAVERDRNSVNALINSSIWILCFCGSLYSLLLLVIDRYLAVTKPFRYYEVSSLYPKLLCVLGIKGPQESSKFNNVSQSKT